MVHIVAPERLRAHAEEEGGMVRRRQRSPGGTQMYDKLDFGGMSFDEWQAQGHDTHSLIANPGFADPKKGDFRLPPESPALKIGFEPIDLGEVGPRDGRQ